MKVVLIGCVEFSRTALEALTAIKPVNLCGIVTKKYSPINADFVDLGLHPKAINIPTHYYNSARQSDLKSFLLDTQPDIIFCVGWSHLLNKDVLDIPPLGGIGYHPAALPQNRGRHPIIWALALGLSKTASTFFMLKETADSGAIVHQEHLKIEPSDNATTLYKKLTDISAKQVKVICNNLISGTINTIEQDETRASSWRKRDMADGTIDWRMSSNTIHNLVRALAPPYPGALCYIDGRRANVWHTKLEHNSIAENTVPGTILCRKGFDLLVKCGEKAIWLLDYQIVDLPEKGDCL